MNCPSQLRNVVVGGASQKTSWVAYPFALKRVGLSFLSIDQNRRVVGSPASTTAEQNCSLSNSQAEIVLVGLRMDQKTHVDAPQEQILQIKLRKAFDEVSYSFEKILGEVRGDSNLVLAKQAVNQLQISLNQFENLLKEGGSTVKSCDSINNLYQEIEHPLSELRRYFMKEPSEIMTDKAGVVYVNALKASFRRLMDIADEMDEGHSSILKSAL